MKSIDRVRRHVTALKERSHMSDAALARAVGNKPAWASLFLRGKRRGVPLKVLDRLADFFQTDVSVFLADNLTASDYDQILAKRDPLGHVSSVQRAAPSQETTVAPAVEVGLRQPEGAAEYALLREEIAALVRLVLDLRREANPRQTKRDHRGRSQRKGSARKARG